MARKAEEFLASTGADEDGGNRGYKVNYKSDYFPVPPTDHFADLRTAVQVEAGQLHWPYPANSPHKANASTQPTQSRHDDWPPLPGKSHPPTKPATS